jgi:hypothetical protein
MDGVDDLSVIDPAQAHRRHPEIGMPELPLYDRDRDPLARHLDRVGVPKLMRSEATANTGTNGSRSELLARG